MRKINVTIRRTPFRFVCSLSLFASFFLPLAVQAQPPAPVSAPVTVAPVDPAIAAALQQVSPDRIHATIEKLVSFNNRSTLSSMDTDLAPGTGINAAADWIFSQFQSYSAECGGCLEVKRDVFIEPAVPGSRIIRPTRLQNIYAVLKGTDSDQAARRVLITGHYDSRNSDNFDTHTPAPGANDDASGTAVSMECARVLSKLKFPSTIVFVTVAGEEQGLFGSRHLARLAKSEGWQLEAVLNNDIVGGDTTPGVNADKSVVRIFSEGIPATATPQEIRTIESIGADSDSTSRELARAIADVGRTYFTPSMQRAAALPGQVHSNAIRRLPAFHPVLIFRRDRFLRGGDHTSFNLEGFTAVRITEWQENFNHQHQNPRIDTGTLPDGSKGPIQYGDLIQYDDFNYMANVARLNAASLATFASAPGLPRNVTVLNPPYDPRTSLTWERPAGMPANATFEVVYRETQAPDWTNVVSAGNATSIILPISKDNTIFGVRSVDPAGHRSAAVYPMPAANNVPPVPGTTIPAAK